jgi:hypothetical protein
MLLACDLAVNERYSVRLMVRQGSHEADVWDWTCFLQNDHVIASGRMPTKMAAQVAGQRAYEAWVHRHRHEFRSPSGSAYQWKEIE